MQTNILWTGREYYSLENCLVNTNESGSEITSTIIGHYEEKIYQVAYSIRTNRNWETVFFEINARHSNQAQSFRYEGDGRGNWVSEGKEKSEFKGCLDIDIPLTPFTNTLPINRLHLAISQAQEIKVIYLDVLAREVRPVRQKYTRVSQLEYQYENVPNDFEAKIQVDEAGLVVDYPGLFVRRAERRTNYQ